MPEVEFLCAGAEDSVSVAGSWASWRAQQLNRNQEGGWSRKLSIPAGTHEYKYIVDGEWLHDPTKPFREDNSGNINNVIDVEEEDEEDEVEEGEGDAPRCSCRHGSEEGEVGESWLTEEARRYVQNNPKSSGGDAPSEAGGEDDSEDEDDKEIHDSEDEDDKEIRELEEALAQADEAEVAGYIDVARGAPGPGDWIKQALGKEKVKTREEQQAELRVTALRVMVLHKEVKELQQKLGTPWHKEVKEARKELGFRSLPSGAISSSELGRNKSPGM